MPDQIGPTTYTMTRCGMCVYLRAEMICRGVAYEIVRYYCAHRSRKTRFCLGNTDTPVDCPVVKGED